MDNSVDMVTKDRHSRGERQYKRTHLKDADITAIREMAKNGNRHIDIGPMFNISLSTVRSIVQRIHWKHVP